MHYHYKKHSYRLAEETVERLLLVKKKDGITFNKLINRLLDTYEEKENAHRQSTARDPELPHVYKERRMGTKKTRLPPAHT